MMNAAVIRIGAIIMVAGVFLTVLLAIVFAEPNVYRIPGAQLQSVSKAFRLVLHAAGSAPVQVEIWVYDETGAGVRVNTLSVPGNGFLEQRGDDLDLEFKDHWERRTVVLKADAHLNISASVTSRESGGTGFLSVYEDPPRGLWDKIVFFTVIRKWLFKM